MKTIGFHVGRFGVYLFLQSLWRYKQIYVVPGVSIEYVKGYDRYLDFALRFLCFVAGIRFIWRKH